jgi:hypothetical protein
VNQTQIRYFEEKVKAAKAQVKSSILRNIQEHPTLTAGVKAAQIQSGKARFKIERFSGPDCPYGAKELFKFFEFEGEDEITAKNALINKRADKLISKIEREAEKIATNFVLEKLKDPSKALDDFIEKYTLKEEI